MKATILFIGQLIVTAQTAEPTGTLTLACQGEVDPIVRTI
jgi:hypothetical protein